MSTTLVAVGQTGVTDRELAKPERLRLESLERVIERGLAKFVEVGKALLGIRDRRVYQATHGSFEQYCRQRWGFRRAHAHRLIQSARGLQALSPMGDTPASERQARELTPLLSDSQPAATSMVRRPRARGTLGRAGHGQGGTGNRANERARRDR